MGAGMKSGRTRSLTLTGWATLLIFASCGCAQRAAPEASAPESSAAAPTIAPSTAPRVCTRWTPDWRDKCDELEPSATITTATANSTEPLPATSGPSPEPVPQPSPEDQTTTSPPAATHTLAGEVFVDSPQEYPSHPCTGGTIYPDLAVGSTVTIRTASGKELAQGTFSSSWLTSGPTRVLGQPDDYITYLCHLKFSVKRLPDKTSYVVYLASRRTKQFSLSAMETAGWSIKITVGDGSWSQ